MHSRNHQRRRKLMLRLRELTTPKKPTTSPQHAPAKQTKPANDVLLCDVSSMYILYDIETLKNQLAYWCSQTPILDTLTSKLETFRRKHDDLTRTYVSVLRELDELRFAYLRKEDVARQAISAKDAISNELHWKSQENALLRLQNLERWEEICKMTDCLEHLANAGPSSDSALDDTDDLEEDPRTGMHPVIYSIPWDISP